MAKEQSASPVRRVAGFGLIASGLLLPLTGCFSIPGRPGDPQVPACLERFLPVDHGSGVFGRYSHDASAIGWSHEPDKRRRRLHVSLHLACQRG